MKTIARRALTGLLCGIFLSFFLCFTLGSAGLVSWSRAIVVGGLAGIVGGWAFGQWMAKVNHFPLIAGLIHLSSRNAGVTLHFVFAFIIGVPLGCCFSVMFAGIGLAWDGDWVTALSGGFLVR